VMPDLSGHPLHGVVRAIFRRGRLCVGIEIGPEDTRRRCGQEVFVDNGFGRVAAVVVGQTAGGHVLVGGGEVVRPHGGRVRSSHRGVVAHAPQRGQGDAARFDLAEAYPQRAVGHRAVGIAESPWLGQRTK